MFRRSKPQGRIFISYRRSDAHGIAGRLNDSLDDYFGDGRVFRDTRDIEPGADFGAVIDGTLGRAQAVIVLIGPGWLDARGPDGARRLDDPGDWVAREVAHALEQGVPVFPVLVEGTPMPRASELPASLARLARRNAIQVQDRTWAHDVTRLAKTIALDLPGSAVERRLGAVNLAVCLALVASVAFTVLRAAAHFVGDWRDPTVPGSPRALMALSESSLTFVLLIGASVLLLVHARFLEARARSYAVAAGLVGLGGTCLCFMLLKPLDDAWEVPMLLAGSTITSSAVLALMSLSGMRPR